VFIKRSTKLSVGNQIVIDKETLMGNDMLKSSDAIAHRELAIADSTGKLVSKVSILVGKPHENGDKWSCDFSVTGIGDDRTYSVHGIDGLQAIQDLSVVINGVLMGSDTYKQGLLCWYDGSKWEPITR
jgi:hypothetical protein